MSLTNNIIFYADNFGTGVLEGCEHKQRSSKIPCHGSPPRWLPGFWFETLLNFPNEFSYTIMKAYTHCYVDIKLSILINLIIRLCILVYSFPWSVDSNDFL